MQSEEAFLFGTGWCVSGLCQLVLITLNECHSKNSCLRNRSIMSEEEKRKDEACLLRYFFHDCHYVRWILANFISQCLQKDRHLYDLKRFELTCRWKTSGSTVSHLDCNVCKIL